MKFLILILTLFSLAAAEAGKLPEISPTDVGEILTQIMHSHVAYKQLTQPLIKRALAEYLEELDPSKVYFLKPEITDWLNPSEEQLDQITRAMEKADFSYFEILQNRLVAAIERRNRLESEDLDIHPLETSLNALQEADWAANENELKERLAFLKSLQIAVAQKLDDPSKEKTLLRIAKRRKSKEDEWMSDDPTQKERVMLTHILKAFSSSFDTHTAYFTPTEASQFLVQVQQRLFGIGVQLRDDLNGFTVVKIIPDGPARDSDLKVNDRLIAINGEPIVGMDLADAVELIRGEEGTSVCLTILRNCDNTEEKHEIEITRKEVVIQEARLESKAIPYADGAIAYLALHAFYQDRQHSSAEDLYEAFLKIKNDYKIKGIILDLRNNSGGVMPQAVAVVGLFITKGIVVSIKDNAGNLEHLRNIDGKTIYDGPLIVLTSKASASAAEIVAQTLQDYGRALVVGDSHTFGKGTFQSFTLDTVSAGKINPKGEFKVTRGRYYTVSGKSPQLVGVKPDLIVPGFYSEIPIGEQHAKFPLENDSIDDNFQDDLSDIPSFQRDQVSWLYRFNLQPRLKTFTRYLSILKANSELRLQEDPFFQNFLAALKNDDLDKNAADLFRQNDPQLRETINIMKDLILLLN